MGPTIAIVEDEEALREAVADYLAGRGLRVLTAANAQEMRALALSEAIDVAVIDISMPGESGLALARWLRAQGTRPGIIFATAAGATQERIEGLELGADDYVVKPYELRELAARIKSVLRRLPETSGQPSDAPAQESPPPVQRFGGFLLDTLEGRLTLPGGANVALSPREIELFLVFAKRPNRLLTRGQLLELAGGHEGEASQRSIDVRIARLRAKIEPGADSPKVIRTIRGEGYMFVPESA